MYFVINLVFLLMKMGTCVAEVFCQDTHATDWTPLGFSCPVNCASVVAAVKRLKGMDLEEMKSSKYAPIPLNISQFDLSDISIEENEPSADKVEDYWTRSLLLRYRNEIDTAVLTPVQYIELYRTLSDKRIAREVQIAFKYAASQFKNESCGMYNKGRGGKWSILGEKCPKKSDIKEQFVKTFTQTLNKHKKSHIFTKKSIEMILALFLNHDTDLLSMDAQKLLKKLKYAIFIHKKYVRAAAKHTITLKSKYCLNIYVPGCFCISGYVEHNGQCVSPLDCFDYDDNDNTEYLARITVE